MRKIQIYTNEATGRVKPMHAVNNGPVYKFHADQRITNLDAFREAGIPYVRNHDASIYYTYGGEHIVDVNAIFPNFDADPEDPASYDFVCTDEYLKVIDLAGSKTYYRLGSKIEHWVKKYNTLPPRDFHKWAVICEHIIRHYNEGWANGFHLNIEYWEIWNEPDLDPDDGDNKRNWGGTAKQFYELFRVTQNHLKSCFPHLKIGGPASCWVNEEWLEGFFPSLDIKPDFYSWHAYNRTVEGVVKECIHAREVLERYGLSDTESILNEWNYVQGWLDDEWIYSIRSMKSLKGASFVAGVMCACQYAPVDMLMYYDARPCAMNGMFDTDLVCDLLKGYYPFKMFHTLYQCEASYRVDTEHAENIYVAAAGNADGKTAIMLTYFDNEERERACQVELELVGGIKNATARIYFLDEARDMEEGRVELRDGKLTLPMSLFTTVLIEIE